MAGLEDEFGDVIAKARIGAGCTVEQVAGASQISATDIASMEAYRLQPSREQAIKLANVLSLNPDKLVGLFSDGWTPRAPQLSRENVIIERIEVPYGAYGSNCYVIGCRRTGSGAVVDPGGAAGEIGRVLAGNNLRLELVLITHAHADHIGGLKQLLPEWPEAKVVNHQLERDSVIRGTSVRWEPAMDGINIRVGDLTITPLFTPGHTPGSTCFLVDGSCFTGDTLFAGSIGRPRTTEVYPQMLSSIRTRVLSLPDDTLLLPGHGPVTSVGEEKEHNPFF